MHKKNDLAEVYISFMQLFCRDSVLVSVSKHYDSVSVSWCNDSLGLGLGLAAPWLGFGLGVNLGGLEYNTGDQY